MAETREIRVPAREGRGLRVAAGELIRIIDLEGEQACDFFAFVDGRPREFLSTTCSRWPSGDLLPRQGTVFVSNLRRPLLTFLEDGAGGPHDMLLSACSRERYRQGWGAEGHPSCRENCVTAVSGFFELPYEYVPDPINFFTDFRVTPDLRLELLPSYTAPGAYVVLRPELDLIVAVSACPFDIDTRLNAGRPTDLLVRLERGAA